MLGRNAPRLLKQIVPPLLAFILGYCWALAGSEEQTQTELENELPLFTGPSVSLLILILSSPGNNQLRDTIRQTWLSVSKKNHNFQSFFVVGDRGLNTKQVYDLAQEKSRHSDLIVLSRLQDSYAELTKKLVKTFEYVNTNFKFDYILKCDDDTFVDIERIVEELSSTKDPFLYWGFFDGRAPVQTKGKWADTSYKLCDRYIPYALGGGYVLGRELVKFVADNSRILEPYNSEDATLGAWMAGLKVNRKHDTRFDTEWQSRGCSNKFLVTHKQTEADMKIKWNRLRKYGFICESAETKVRLSYNYDWSKPPSECCVRSDHSLP